MLIKSIESLPGMEITGRDRKKNYSAADSVSLLKVSP